MNQSQAFRFDGAINIPTIIALVGAIVTLWGAVVANATETKSLEKRVDRVEDLPERVSAIEATQREMKQSLLRIEGKLDRTLGISE